MGEKFIIWILTLLLVIILNALLAYPVMLLWNSIMPDIFGIKEVTYLQMFGLMVLADILFKSNPGVGNDRNS
jgi:hypothetical protein